MTLSLVRQDLDRPLFVWSVLILLAERRHRNDVVTTGQHPSIPIFLRLARNGRRGWVLDLQPMRRAVRRPESLRYNAFTAELAGMLVRSLLLGRRLRLVIGRVAVVCAGAVFMHRVGSSMGDEKVKRPLFILRRPGGDALSAQVRN